MSDRQYRPRSRPRSAGALFTASFAALLAVTGVWAQSTSATLAGRLVDAKGVEVAGVRVVVYETTTGLEREAASGPQGAFAFPNLPPGLYRAEASAEGYRTARTAEIMLNVNDRREVELMLVEADSAVDVTVEAGGGVDADPAVSTVVDQHAVDDLPLNGRSFQNLIAMTPGVVQTPANFDDRGTFSSHGARTSSNSFTIDGVSANYAVALGIEQAVRSVGGNLAAFSASGGTNSMIAVDALREFKVQTSTYAPEIGRFAGAHVSMATRSGGNDLHGSAFYYFRNAVFDANDFFANRNGVEKPATRQSDFGGVLGGPIVRDRTFFFGAYEQLDLDQPQTSSQPYPTLAYRETVAPWIRPIVDSYPIPNGASVGENAALVSASYTIPSRLHAASVRVDHAASATTMLFGRASVSPSTIYARGADNATGATLSYYGPNRAQAASGMLGLIQMLSARVSHEARISHSGYRARASGTLDGFGGGSAPDPNAWLPEGRTLETAQIIVAAAPVPSVAAGVFSGASQRQWALADTVSLLAGRHEIRAGFDYRRQTPDYRDPTYRQAAIFTALTGPGGLASGVPAALWIEESEAIRLERENWSWFAQDHWMVGDRLSLTYGLRWDYNPAPGGLDGFEPYAVLYADDPSRATLSEPGTPAYRASKASFAPRLAGAYRLSSRSGREAILRAGAGVFYDIPVGADAALRTSEPVQRTVLRYGVPYPYVDPAGSALPFEDEPPFGVLEGFEPDLEAPRMIYWSAALRFGLGDDRTLDVTYVGSAGRRLWRREQYQRPNSYTQSLEVIRSADRSDYNGLEVQLEQRLRGRLTALASYTWAHAIDTGSSVAAVSPGGWDPRRDRASADFDVRHLFSGGWSWDLPGDGFGPLARGWGVDGVFRLQSALPFHPTDESISLPVEPLLRLDRVPGEPVWLEGENYPGGRAVNPAAFVAPAGVQGDFPRNGLRAFPLRQVDLAARRSFRLTENVSLRFSVEMFNAFNTSNFGPPVAALSQLDFGVADRTYGRGLGSGGAIGGQNPLHAVGGPRSTQLALRIEF